MGLVPVLLTACDARRDALVYTDAGACTAARVLTDDECTRAAQTAGTVAGVASPHYTDRAHCIEQFGDRCVITRGRLGPRMSGFVVARDANGSGEHDARPLYRNRVGQWLTGSGTSIGYSSGAVEVPSSVLTADAVPTTVSRGGFGTRAASRSGSFAFGA